MATKETCALASFLAACLGLVLHRLRQCAFYGPAFIKSTIQCASWYSNLLRPIWNTLRYPIEFNHLNAGTIDGLLFWRCPATVSCPSIFNALITMPTRIAFRSIDSINAVRCGWLWPNVGVEVLKRLPSLAYYYAVSSVVGKGFQVRVMAALLHVMPRTIFRRVGHAVASLSAWIATVTAVSSQQVSTDRPRCSALALADPIDFLGRMVCCPVDNRPFTESLPHQVYKAMIATIRIAVSHLNLLQRFKVVRSAMQLQLSGCSHFSSLFLGGQL